MSDKNDKLLLKALKSNDVNLINSAFERIYNDYVKLTAFVICRYVRDNETVKELTNETFLRFYEHADKINGSIKGYLAATAKNLALDYLDGVKAYEPLSGNDGAYEDCHSLYYDDIISGLKKKLNENELEIVLMRLVEDLTFRDIAKRLGRNLNTVITTYNRAVKKYKKGGGSEE